MGWPAPFIQREWPSSLGGHTCHERFKDDFTYWSSGRSILKTKLFSHKTGVVLPGFSLAVWFSPDKALQPEKEPLQKCPWFVDTPKSDTRSYTSMFLRSQRYPRCHDDYLSAYTFSGTLIMF